MRTFVVLLFLLLIAGAGAYVTRPTEGLHRGVASVLMKQGKVERPDEATGRYAFEDFYVVTLSRMSTGDRDVLQCWGIYTRFLCVGPAGGPQPPIVATPGA
ncbi:MAG TPA: hypothetical protein PLN33_12040 [Hyphomonadaceae bacterium]|jgi:hypothetical protein|nr:hypothetical protein [Hyphomonadaceae bacterium]HPN07485.1 hypothetical protein [Hyphomonadaceae bacterium]